MRRWETIFKERLEQAGSELPAEDWTGLQERYASLKERRVLRNRALVAFPAAFAAGLALFFFLREPAVPQIPPAAPDAPLLAQGKVTETEVTEAGLPPESLDPPGDRQPSPKPAAATAPPSPSPAPAPPEDSVPADDVPQPDGSAPDAAEPHDAGAESRDPEIIPAVPILQEPVLPQGGREEGIPASGRMSRKASLSTSGTFAHQEGGTVQAGRHVYSDAASQIAGAGNEVGIASRSHFQKIAAFTLAQDTKIGEIHHRPLELGLTAGFPLTPRWTLVSGVEYARYPSSFSYSVSGTKKQEAHYLGIPLRFDYQLVDRDRLHVYLGAGTQIDRGILARLDGEKIRADGFGFSLLGAGGIQWDLTPFLGLYLEPRYSLFLSDSEGRLATFRTESPARFSLAAGFRINL